MKTLISKLVAGLALASLASAAHAQGAPAPVGMWLTDPASERLTVQADGTCMLESVMGAPTYGPCQWTPSATGGILTIISQATYKPAPVYFNVLWIDQQTISVMGDIFHRAG